MGINFLFAPYLIILAHKCSTFYLRYQDYLVGVSVDFNSTEKKLKFVDVAFGYSISDFGFHGIITDWARTFTAGVYQRLSNTLEYAAEVSFFWDHYFLALSFMHNYFKFLIQNPSLVAFINPSF